MTGSGDPDPVIEYWTGDTYQIAPGLTLINAGTHFAGGTVLHWVMTQRDAARCSAATSSWS